MNEIVIDFETFYSSKKKYSLRNLSTTEYVYHPEFHIQGYALKVNDSCTEWHHGTEGLDQIDWANNKVIAHNVKFDGLILKKLGYIAAEYVDTKAMAKATLGNSIPSSSLKNVGEALGLPSKGELKTNNKKELTGDEEADLSQYCIRDVDICYGIYSALRDRIPASQWLLIDWTVKAFLEPRILIDKATCKKVFDTSVENKKKLVAEAGVDEKALASNQQFAELLRSKGFKVPLKANPKGERIPALSISDKEFLEMRRSEDKGLKALVEARVAVKQTLEETRSEKLARISDISPYRFDVIFSGAQQTHRFSGGSGCAGNPQNFRRGSNLRAALKAPEGQSLIVADFSNIELRVLAFLSKDPNLMYAIETQQDVYCQFASKVYGRKITKQDKKERMLGKAAVLGLGYGMGAKKFIGTVYSQTGESLPFEFAQQIVDLYRQTYFGVPQFWKTCEKVLDLIYTTDKKCGFPLVPFLGLERNSVVLPSGLKVQYPNLRYTAKMMFNRIRKEWVYDRYKSQKGSLDAQKIYGGMVTENICQAIAGEICKEAIVRLIDNGYPPVGQVHDELLVVCPDNEVEQAKHIVTVCMTDPMSWFPELPLEVEINAGKNWLEAK